MLSHLEKHEAVYLLFPPLDITSKQNMAPTTMDFSLSSGTQGTLAQSKEAAWQVALVLGERKVTKPQTFNLN